MSVDVAVRIRISGRVQGVWYRGWAVENATARGLRGWVRNRRDGKVEALLIGPADRCVSGGPADGAGHEYRTIWHRG